MRSARLRWLLLTDCNGVYARFRKKQSAVADMRPLRGTYPRAIVGTCGEFGESGIQQISKAKGEGPILAIGKDLRTGIRGQVPLGYGGVRPADRMVANR
jgi:hypothetical protein